MNASNNTATKVIRRDVVLAENGTYSVVAVMTQGAAFWHNDFATKAEAQNFAKWS